MLHLDAVPRSRNRKELTWIKTNMERKVDKVLLGEIFIVIGKSPYLGKFTENVDEF